MKRVVTLRPYLIAIILLLMFLLATTVSSAAAPNIEQAKLVASDAAAPDRFGYSVAISGDTALIGAYRNADDGANSGSAYVFTCSGTAWTQQAKLTASDAATGDSFGISVAISGDTALVGAIGDSDAGTYSGSVYVFTRSGTAWTEQAKLTAGDAVDQDYFGWSVAISGDTALVGAYKDDDDGNSSGSAYVFNRSGLTWTEQTKLTASDANSGDEFGLSVAISGDTALVGAYKDDDDGNSSGSAYIFDRSGTTWTEQAKLTASDAATGDYFGYSVAISGDTALVGALLDDDGGDNSGSAYVFGRSGTTWTEQAKLTASDASTQDSFGHSVAVSGDTALVGAYADDDGGNSSGSAYIFVPDNQPPTAAAGGPYLGAVSEPIVFDGSGSTDPDGDALTYAWDFGDGSIGVGQMPAHSYAMSGIYDVCLTVDDGSVVSGPDCTMAVVYDPDGGFVTGGGWIDSPTGAYAADPTATGRANFGFVSKYKKGANTPTGQTEFRFTAGDLEFHSTSYDWLVVAGAHAKYKGVGTVNGAGNYGFMLTATDSDIQGGGASDSFRIKLWNMGDGDAVIYDNQPGADEYVYDGTELGGGNIKIHKG